MSVTLPPLRLTGAAILRDGALQKRSLVIENGLITKGPLPEVDMSGYLLLPGIIDLHGDAFERHIAPRPSARMPIRSGLRWAAREAAAHGVTTAWLAQCWSWEGGLRAPEFAEQVMEALNAERTRALIDLRIQIRCETHLPDTRQRLLTAIRRYGIDYVVFNNHLPEALELAASQPHKLGQWASTNNCTPPEFLSLLNAAQARSREVPRHLCALAESFDEWGVRYGSHDDPDAETREYYRIIGARIAEFPTSASAAKLARACNDPVLMGAPNVVRGGSQSGGVSALHLISRGLCDALVSDYHYPCLAEAAWVLVDKGVRDLPQAWDMISRVPAEIMGLADRGRLDHGMRADFVVINEATREIEATVSGGRLAYLAGEAGARLVGAMAGPRLAAE
ncbi:alpha-D-ribose 1-methylphosphonate 5-triphosphate diphosphatase [Salipiger sp. 1_MG-2023]|uniref:alpha-D-ribose 1-methylphosphonate 5-triphosphate diphosphatase n=1 Tax=Salipiger sp. 1_MG-2023 TaxID=3062665 RepID=UPI0026E2C211|nr:alpha-D-ribose 1-methylphosphonate 5-triphosphate diphosphatase [Salipiger sp. 1_MG-2023]MDO6588092.1 alpha-D-ribose 1-methylphosphonate 5-triphosphate diphosphatase [Salipiger sp. 1_MG-2023]